MKFFEKKQQIQYQWVWLEFQTAAMQWLSTSLCLSTTTNNNIETVTKRCKMRQQSKVNIGIRDTMTKIKHKELNPVDHDEFLFKNDQ